MRNNITICIGRQYASGGLIIGDRLSQKLNYSFYDKELITVASKKTGLGKEFFEQVDEKSTHGLLGGLLGLRSNMISDYYTNNYLSNESLFKIQSDIIHELAQKESCVFVGRCADYILRENPNCISIFITASKEDRIKRFMEREKEWMEMDKALDLLEKTDKKRAAYYTYYTNKVWGAAESYDLCINSSELGLDGTVDFILTFLEKKFGVNKVN